MKHELLSLFFAAIVAMNVYAADVWDGSSDIFTHGAGTEQSPYLIENAEQLAFIAEMVNAGIYTYSGNYFKLTTDLDLNNTPWTPIGESEEHAFGGSFDGDNHIISNLRITSATNAGLFGVVSGGTYKRITVQGNIPASANATNAGGLIGYATAATSVDGCVINVEIGGSTNAGGLIGKAKYIYAFNCKNEANVNGTYAGGLIGNCTKASLQNSTNTGSINSSSAAAGIIGAADTATIQNVANFGTVTAQSNSNQFRTRNYTSDYGSEINGRYFRNHVEDWSIGVNGYCGGIVSKGGYIDMNMCINYGDVKLSAEISTSALKNNNRTEGKYNYKTAYTDNMYNYTWNFTNPCGGLVGWLGEGRIHNSANNGNLYGNINVPSDPNCSSITKNYILGCAGVCGVIQGDKACDIFKCCNTGNIICGYYSGGVIGNQMSSLNTTINSSFSTGNIIGTISSGIAAQANKLQIKNCYSAGETSLGIGAGTVTNSYYINGSGNGTQKSEAQMKSASMPILLNADSTVFVQDVKPYVNKGYPIFKNCMKYIATNDASDVSYTSAIIHGNYYNCTPLVMGFEYKEEGAENYLSQTVSNASPAQYELTNLAQGTSYVARYWLVDNGIKYFGDTIHFTTLACPTKPVRSDTVALCQGESYEFAGKTLTQAGVYHDSLVATTGCDSVIELVLQVTETYKYPRTETINRGESYDFYGQLLTEPGVYNEYIRTTNRCNWIELTLIVHEPDKTLTLNVNNPLWGSVIGAGTFEHGTVAEFSAIPAEGCYFVNWSDGDTNAERAILLTKDTTITANFAISQYTITTQATNGTITGGGTYNYGTQVNLTAVADEHYHFVRWSDGNTNSTRQVIVTEDKTYSAIFELDKFLVLFKDDDGTELKSDEVEYGAMPVAPADPTKESTAQYDYTFAGWTPTIAIVTQAATYTATYTSSLREYLVTFLNEDNSIISSKNYKYGETPVAPADPVKQNTAEYTYTFNGWDNAIAQVHGPQTYKATFTATKNSYTITWQNEDGSLIDQTTVEYGVVPTHAGPTKENTAEYTYTFAGWTPAVVAVTGNATYRATFSATKNKYLITFRNDDGTVLKSEEVEYGMLPIAPATPTKESTAQYNYEFAGWTPSVKLVSQAATYTATYNASVREYLVTFLNDDNSIISMQSCKYGSYPTIPSTPTKQATAEYTYTFTGWTPAVVAVTGDATYKATFTATKNSYTITWQNEDGSLIDQTTVEYGVVPTHAEPTKEATAEYTYTFAGWTPAVVAVTGDATYKATFSSVVNVYTISVSAVNGQVIGGGEYQYGTTTDLTAIPDEGYVFDQWSDGVTDNPRTITVTGDAEYTALFTSTEGVDNINTSEPVQKVIIDQKVYILRGEKVYTLTGQEVK